ncbi:glycosyl transferase family 90 [Actinoplanes sp. NPDC049265]|uniref:glycosyl transferase family 90 n=1 Tax=Actinoplanes sp. NPDC049265 TaxID=3363902 RepID=UPI003723F89C
MTPTGALAAVRAHQHEQFASIRDGGGVRSSTLDEFEDLLRTPGALSRPSLIARCRITGGDSDVRVVVDKAISRVRLTRAFLPFLRRTAHRMNRPADFFVLLSDGLYVAPEHRPRLLELLRTVPLLRCDRRDDDEVSSRGILIPDFSILDPAYATELASATRAGDAVPFDDRLDVVKWRGTLSGPGYPDIGNRLDFPRYRLLMLSLRRPDVLDARLITYDNMTGSDAAVALQRHLRELFGDPCDRLPVEAFARYRHLLSLDGAVAAWKRVPTILATGSVLLLQHRWEQFFYAGLRPWVHYIPIRDDLSDLVDRHEWLVADRARAETIARNGRLFAAEVLQPAVLDTFLLEAIRGCTTR